MRKHSSKSDHQSEELLFGDFEDMSEDQFFEQFEKKDSRKSSKRKRDARRQIERYNEDRELARWINDYHLEA
ncbi:PA3496 family putative envelope integrity protein [Arenicella xantha]|uniref:Uncharacterized protein n=1 Tax=Arenicella xantha TaxID=644221 RepID=A0A395JJJ7_9GAMM|nr:hypothetical protein [Arenicella xantha]RBP50861.1 hypothetical protein DFR28_102277 [Arenicella xantha]